VFIFSVLITFELPQSEIFIAPNVSEARPLGGLHSRALVIKSRLGRFVGCREAIDSISPLLTRRALTLALPYLIK